MGVDWIGKTSHCPLMKMRIPFPSCVCCILDEATDDDDDDDDDGEDDDDDDDDYIDDDVDHDEKFCLSCVCWTLRDDDDGAMIMGIS